MNYRNIYPELEESLSVKQTIVITGMRRVGKTTALKHLLDKIKSKNKIYLDLERVEMRTVFNEPDYRNIIKGIELEGIDFTKKAFIAIDEIQLVPNITSVIKYLYDTYNIKFLVTGSSSFYLKNHFSESLSGRKRVFEMLPLAFDEMLRFKGEKVKQPETNFETLQPAFYRKYASYYDEYIRFGGFPEVVLCETDKNRTYLLSDILNSYLNIDILRLSDFNRVDELYKLIRLLAGRVGSRIDYTKLSGISGIDRKKIKEYLEFLEQTFLIHQVPAFSKNTDREIAQQKKLYFSDSGLLNTLGQVSSGALFENTVAMQLFRKGKLAYYTKKTGQEIDFILDENTAFEVKETPTPSDLAILKSRANDLGIPKQYLIGQKFSNTSFTDFVWGGSLY